MLKLTRYIPRVPPPSHYLRLRVGFNVSRYFSVSTQHPAPAKITTHFGGKDCAPPRASVPYSPAAKANGFVFVSGQVAANSKGEYLPASTSVTEKTHKMIQNVKSILEASGSSLDQVVKANIIFVNLDRDYDEFNKVYKEYFPHNPARTSIEVSGLPKPADLEIEVIALAD